MKFKSALYISYVIKDINLPTNPMLEFTKTQIFYPDDANLTWQESHIRNGVYYKLIVNDKSIIRHRYEIKVEGSPLLGLQINRKNERKLKWIHGMYRCQKEPLAYTTIILSVLTLLATILLGVLNLKCK